MEKVKRNFYRTGITGIGDPFVMRTDSGSYYMYATSFKTADGVPGFNVWASDDLKNWSSPKQCYRRNADSFGVSDFWAPEVVQTADGFVMHYSARGRDGSLRICAAACDSPDGEFADVFADKPMFDFGYAAIDGHVFRDDDGRTFFYYSRDCSENLCGEFHESHIYVADMSADCLHIEQPRLVIKPESAYERVTHDGFVWNEGPFVIKRGGKYYMTYSANFFASKNYCTCCAVSDRPDCGFVKYSQPVIDWRGSGLSGPGHCSVTYLDGKPVIAFHAHTDSDRPSEDRQMYLGRIVFDGGRLTVEGF